MQRVSKETIDKIYPESKFGNFTNVDGTVFFYLRMQSLVKSNFTILDVGCGRGQEIDKDDFIGMLRVFRGKVKYIIGIDVEDAGRNNPNLDEFRLIDTTKKEWPVETGSIDLLYADWVIEHVSDVKSFLGECHRVLKPGGYVCFRTSNRLNYIGIVSSLIPNKLHGKVTGFAQKGRDEEDVFPAVYECNTVFKLKSALSSAGFDACSYGHNAEPAYFNFSSVVFSIFAFLHRITPPVFANTLFAFGRKK